MADTEAVRLEHADLAGQPIATAPQKIYQLDTLTPLGYNPRTITEEEAEQLERNLERFGMVQDLVVNTYPGREGNLVGGFQRWTLLRHKGNVRGLCKEVYLDEAAERELNFRLNANTAGWDFGQLAADHHRETLEQWGAHSVDLELFDAVAEELAAEEDSGRRSSDDTADDSGPADVRLIFGEYRVLVPRDRFDALIAELNGRGIYSSDAIEAELLERLLGSASDGASTSLESDPVDVQPADG